MNKLLAQYAKLAEFLGNTLGDTFEIILYQVDKKDAHVIFVINGKFGEHQLGDIFDENNSIAFSSISDLHVNYLNFMEDSEKSPKSSYFFIKDETATIIGILAINNYQASSNLTIEDSIRNTQIFEDFLSKQSSIFDLVNQTLEQHNLIKKEKLTISEKMLVIEELYKRNIFQRKGIITELSNCLNISEPSLYRYVARIKTKSENNEE